jgi:Arc/MetJ-type ribon-helix-helix transcriptional regulator
MTYFVDEHVKAGRFCSASEVLEAGIARLMLDTEPDVLDEQDLIDIQRSLEQMQRGEVIDSVVLHAQLRRKYLDGQR